MNDRPKILIVEDESLVALDLSCRLPKLGYEVCGVCASGEEAVKLSSEIRPDLVLMDIILQGEMDGVAASEVIRTREQLPVVFLTANSDEVTLARAKDTSPSAFLLKPFKERDLQIGIEMALLNHKLQMAYLEARMDLEVRVAERTVELAKANETLRAENEIRRRAEERAREQADLLAKASDAIYVRDMAGMVTYWNRSAELLYGHTAEEVFGRLVPLLLGESESPESAKAMEATLARGEWSGELVHTTRAGAAVTVSSRWTLVRDGQGQPRHILVVNTDITEKKKIAEQLMRTQRLDVIGGLTMGITHDLNNVFAPILLATELIDPGRDGERDRMVEMIRTSAARGANMVRKLLLFVRGGTAEMQPMRLDHLAEEVRDLMQKTLPPSIKVAGNIGRDLGLVMADATQLHQVLVNLCVNARDAMPDGGTLRIGVEETDVSAEAARLRGDYPAGRYVRLSVGDTGTGMRPEVKARIFEPFFTTKGVGKGTGLGLSTVVSIVRSHGGFLDVESEIGRGSTFLVHLPICAGFASKSDGIEAAIEPGHGETIIVADDEHAIREMTRLTLEANGYRVLLASDGAEVLASFVAHRETVALVLTDISMPVMNGRALIHALRKLDPGVPVIAFSALDRTDPLVGTIDEEHVPLLRKPATPSQLLRAVGERLASVRQGRHAEFQL